MMVIFDDSFNDQRVQHFFDYEYLDRGIVKWQGYFLSDHTSALGRLQQRQQQLFETKLKQQSTAKIKQQIKQAYQQQLPVLVQFNQLEEHTHHLLIIVGMVDMVTEHYCQINNQTYELLDMRGIIEALDDTEPYAIQ